MKYKRQGAEHPIAAGIIWGSATAILVTILLAMLLATLIVNEHIDERQMPYLANIIVFLSVLVGGLIAGKYTKEKCILSTGLTSLTYGLILIGAGILFFNDGFQNFWTSIIVIAIGYVTSCVICIRGKSVKSGRKRYSR